MPRQQQGRYDRERDWRREPQGRYSSERARRSVRGDEDERRDERLEREREYEMDPDSWSERQSGPYRSAETGRNIPEDRYRQETHWHRSQPYTGFSGRVSEFGYEDPAWNVPRASRTTGATVRRYQDPGTGFEGIGPKNYTRSNDRIREDVCDGISDDGEIDARDIDIEVRDCEVTLTGTVPERYMKHRAEDIADSCRGVRDVHNQLRVRRHDLEEERSASP